MIIPVAFALNDNYARQVEVTLTSLFMNAKESTVYHVYLLNNKLKQTTRQRLSRTLATHHPQGQLFFLDIPHELWSHLPIIKRFPQEANARLLLPELLPSTEKIIYLDADIIVLDDLEELYNMDLSRKAFAAFPEGQFLNQSGFASTRLDFIHIYNYFKRDFDIDLTKRNYCNSGVLSMNLNFFRENNFVEESLRFLHKYKDVTDYPDQDALNALAMKNGTQTILEIPYVWNFMVTYLQNSDPTETSHYRSARETRNLEFLRIYTQDPHAAFESYAPRIIHYAAVSPWTKGGMPALYFEKYKEYATLCRWQFSQPTFSTKELLVYAKKAAKFFTPYGIIWFIRKRHKK
jgi:lipopolysaccharide biosynthesis glycosyltransferase